MSMSMSMTAAGEGGEEDSGSEGSDLRLFRDDEDKNVSAVYLHLCTWNDIYLRVNVCLNVDRSVCSSYNVNVTTRV